MSKLHTGLAALSALMTCTVTFLPMPQVQGLQLKARMQDEPTPGDGKKPETNKTKKSLEWEDLLKSMGLGGGLNLQPYEKQPGFATLYTHPSNTEELILDITNVLKGGGLIMVTALASRGTYSDSDGLMVPLHEPMEETETRIFKLVMSSDNKTVKVLQPQLTMRTTDVDTRRAYGKGANSPWIASLQPMPTTLGSTHVVVDGSELIRAGFFVAPGVSGAIQSYRLTKVRSYPTNFDVSLTFLSPAGQMALTFSVIKPPETPMVPRLYDDRLPYFTQTYMDLGLHTEQIGKNIHPRNYDTRVSVIWKYNLQRLPDKQIRIHVDPSVPQRWRKSFKSGIEAWNDAFVEAGYHNYTIRAVLPTDPDWPEDYDAGDARFSTIVWAIDPSAVFSMGIAKVDPRSGEILNSNIVMGAGWVRHWLNDLHTMRLNQTEHLNSGFFREMLHGGGKIGNITLPDITGNSADRASTARLLQVDARSNRSIDAASASKRKAALANEHAALELLDGRWLSLMGVGLPKESWFDIVQAGVKAVVMHEVGHVLGLRHNFKGSIGVSYECTQNMTCSAEQGLSASIMDYIPINIPSSGTENVHLFSPVVGAYDKLAIRYGYTELPINADDASPVTEVSNGMPSTPTFLKRFLEEANQFQVCKDGDYHEGLDPLCNADDLSSDPLRYWEDQVQLLQKVQKTSLQNSVGPGEPYWQYGDVAETVLSKALYIQLGMLQWIGGMNTSYVHRPYDQTTTVGQGPRSRPPAVRTISAEDQRKALRLMLDLARPAKKGILPPSEFLANLPVQVDDGIAAMEIQSTITEAGRITVEFLLSSRTLRLVETSKQFGGLGLDTLIDDVVYQIMGSAKGEGFENSAPQDWDLQRSLVDNLIKKRHWIDFPGGIEPYLSMAVKSATRAVEGGLKRLDGADAPTDWSSCSTPGSPVCSCYGRARLWLGREWSSPVDSLGNMDCKPETFGLESDQVPDRYCECLTTASARAPLRTHLLELRNQLKQGAKSRGWSVESGVSKLSSVWSLLLGFTLTMAQIM